MTLIKNQPESVLTGGFPVSVVAVRSMAQPVLKEWTGDAAKIPSRVEHLEKIEFTGSQVHVVRKIITGVSEVYPHTSPVGTRTAQCSVTLKWLRGAIIPN